MFLEVPPPPVLEVGPSRLDSPEGSHKWTLCGLRNIHGGARAAGDCLERLAIAAIFHRAECRAYNRSNRT